MALDRSLESRRPKLFTWFALLLFNEYFNDVRRRPRLVARDSCRSISPEKKSMAKIINGRPMSQSDPVRLIGFFFVVVVENRNWH